MCQRRRVATKLAHASVALVPYLRNPRNPRSNPAGREQEGREERPERKVGFRSGPPALPAHLCRMVWRNAASMHSDNVVTLFKCSPPASSTATPMLIPTPLAPHEITPHSPVLSTVRSYCSHRAACGESSNAGLPQTPTERSVFRRRRRVR